MKKIISTLGIIVILSNSMIVYAEVDEDFDGAQQSYARNLDEIRDQKVGFLVEGVNSDGTIKRNQDGYDINTFLDNDSVKNINSGFNGDFGNVRLETSSQNNIASYFPSIFNWNIPHKIYRLDGNGEKISGEEIYTNSEISQMCTYGFTRSISASNDITTKVDIYGVSEEGDRLIGKDVYNSEIISFFEKYMKNESNEIFNDALESADEKSILIDTPRGHELYNYANYQGTIKQSIMGPSLTKYSINTYLERVKGELNIFDSEIRFSEISTNETSTVSEGKVSNYIKVGSDLNENEEKKHKYFIINNNKFVKGNSEMEFDVNKLFIKYDDIITGLSNVDSNIIEEIKKNYKENIVAGIPAMLGSDSNNLYERGRLKDTLQLIGAYLQEQNVIIPQEFTDIIINQDAYNNLNSQQLTNLVGFFYEKFISTLELDFKTIYNDGQGNTKLLDLEGNFNQHWPIGTLEEIKTKVGFYIYDNGEEGEEFNFKNTLSYGDIGNSFGYFPFVRNDDGSSSGFQMGFKPINGERNEVKQLYNSIIGGGDIAKENIQDDSYKFIYGLKEILNGSTKKNGELNLKFLYNSPGIVDFYFKNDLNDEEVITGNNLSALLGLSFNFFNNGDKYSIRDISKNKNTTKHPFVFPVSYFLDKNQRDYTYYNSNLQRLSDGETSYFKSCLGDGGLQKLLKATPESKVYTKKINRNGEDFLITYKALEFQFKFAGELAMGSDFGFYGDFPQSESINLGNFMNNKPLKSKSFQGEDFKIENFLSGKSINIWSGFQNRETDRFSYGFRVFKKAGDNLLTYKENGASNRNYDPNSGHLFQPIENNLKKINGDTFGNGEGEMLISTGKDNTIFGGFNYERDLYSSISCPAGYDVYDDYEKIYNEILTNIDTENSLGEIITEFPILENLNYRKINNIEYQRISSYFNDAKPFCIHSSLPKDTNSVINYIKRMFTIDEGTDELNFEERYNYILQNNSNPFIYYDSSKSNFRFSTAYLNTLRSLFSSEYQRFPSYNKISENVDLLYPNGGHEDLLGYINYSDQIEGLVDNIILYNVQKDDQNGIEYSKRYQTQKRKIISYLENQDKALFSGIYGLNLFNNPGQNGEDFTSSVNGEIFPIVGALKVIKPSGIDFFCKDESGNKTNSVILGNKCYNKTTKTIANNENVYINGGEDRSIDNGAFANNTTLLPFFKKGISIPDTSGTLFLNSLVSNQGRLPFISSIDFNENIDKIPLKPRITALRGISNDELIENQLNQGYGYRAGGFLYPYSTFLPVSQKNEFSNLLVNSKLNTDEEIICVNLFDSSEITESNQGKCSGGFFPGYKNGNTFPYLIHNVASTSIGEFENDFTTLEFPLSFGDVQVNKDMDAYAKTEVLNKKAELVAGKSSILVYDGDFQVRNSKINPLTGYIDSEKNKDKGGEFMFFSMINRTGGMNNNSVFYEIESNFIPEVCLFGNNSLNSCIEEYDTFDTTLVSTPGNQEIISDEKVCLELDGTERIYPIGEELNNDIDQTGYCNLSCVTSDNQEKVFSSNNYFLFTENQGDAACIQTEPSKLKIFDGYSLYNYLRDTDEARDLGRNYGPEEGDNGTGVPLVEENGLCYYSNGEEQPAVRCSAGFLSRYSSQIQKDRNDIEDNPGLRNSYNYVDDIELGKNVSTNFNGVYNNDLIILTSNVSPLTGEFMEVQGGYIGANSSIVDPITGGIREPFIFSDNDSRLGEGSVLVNTSILNTNSKEGRQERRNRIKQQIQQSAGNGNELNPNPTSGLNYLSYKIPSEDFYSLNGIFRVAKDSRNYFTNFKVQNPENEEELLADISIGDTYYSHNNLVIKYGNRFYTWGDNDTNCSGVNPNEVYNRIDLYDDVSNSREDTMTLCLSNGEHLSEGHTLDNDLYIILPIKPTRGYNAYTNSNISESNNTMNTSINVENGVINGNRTRRDNRFLLETYFQGYFTNGSNAIDTNMGFLDIFDSGNSDRAMKGRYVSITRNSERDRCDGEPDGRDYWYTGYTEYNANFIPNRILIETAPKAFANGMITRQERDKSIFVLPVQITNTESTYSGSSGRRELQRGSVRGYGCDSDGDEKREARREAREAMTRNIELFNQSEISYGSVSVNTNLREFNPGNIVNSFFIPEFNIDEYRNGINFQTQIKDEYYKAGNLLNNLGPIKGNGNYVKASLQENENKVNVGDYLEFEHRIATNGNFVPQLMFLKTQLDRGLEMDLSTLEIEKNGLRQSPIFNQDEDTQEIVGNRYNTSFIISRINTSNNQEEEVFNNSNSTFRDRVTLQDNEKITVTSGKLFLEVLDDDVSVLGTKGTKYFRGTDSDITLIFERNNGITKDEDLSDIFTDLGTELEQGDILTIGAGEFVRFKDSNVRLRIIPFNSLPEYLLNYSRDKVITTEPVVGIPYLDSGFDDYEIAPSRSQSYYIFECSNLENATNFKRQSTTIDFENTIGEQYCGVFNKYTDNVFNGYLNTASSYNRLVIPSEEYRFTYGDENEDNAKLLGNSGKYKDIAIGRNSRGFMNGDREKQLITNLGVIQNGDSVIVRYKAKVSDINDIGHVLYNYSNLDSKTEQIIREDNDTLLGFLHNKNNDIYSKSANSELFFLTHYGRQVNIYDRVLSLENGGTVSDGIEVTPNIDLSIINLSGRKGYFGCNPVNERSGTCDKIQSIETLNRDGEGFSSEGEVIKKDGESQAILYKGQKFFVRTTITNDHIDKRNSRNTLSQLGLELTYNSQLTLFDGIIIENSFNSDQNILINTQGEKVTVRSEDIDLEIENVINNRSEVIQEIENSSLQASYKTISHNINVDSFNTNGGVTVDYLFTVKNTLNADTIQELFGTAYLKDVGGLFILDSTFQKNEIIEEIYKTQDGNSAYTDVTDYDGSENIDINNNFNNSGIAKENTGMSGQGSKGFQYYKIPFSSEYQFDLESGFITNLNPNLASFKSRIVNIGGNSTGVYSGNSDDGVVALEILLSNTSNQDINLIQNSLVFSIPNGFTVNNIDYTSFEDSNDVELNIVTQELYSLQDNQGVNLNEEYGKKTYRINQENDIIIPGERVQYLIYLDIDRTQVDIYSSFTANIDVVREETLTTLFSDTGINVETGLGDLTIKSLPLISENDAYFGAGFIKNKITNNELLENGTGESGYNIISGNNAQVEYSGGNANNQSLANSIQPEVYNITELTDETVNNYSVIQGNDLTSNSFIRYVGGNNPYYLIIPNGSGEVELQNNTLYYFGETDVVIGEIGTEVGSIVMSSLANTEKARIGGSTIFTQGRISINNNIEILELGNETNFSDINYFAFIGGVIEINPRVSSLDGTYVAPQTNNAFISTTESSSGIRYETSGNIGIIRPGFSNVPLNINGSMTAGNIIREREINESIDGNNVTESFEFDFKLYLGVPPVLRK